jgi:hypothetical protein
MNRIPRSNTILLLCLAFLAVGSFIGSPAFAQVTSGAIPGSVKDPSGAFVKDASVTIMNPSNGLTRTVTTSDNGEFVAPGLYPGTYTVTVEAPGFKKLEKTALCSMPPGNWIRAN